MCYLFRPQLVRISLYGHFAGLPRNLRVNPRLHRKAYLNGIEVWSGLRVEGLNFEYIGRGGREGGATRSL